MAAFGWLRRRSPGGWVLAALMAVVAWWSFCGAIEAAVIAPAAKVLAAKFQYISIASIAPLWLLFALARGKTLSRVSHRVQAALWLLPTIVLVLAFTNERHGLIWTSIRPVSDRWLDVRISQLHDARGLASGRLIVLRDITPLKLAEEERFASLERIGRQQQTVVALAVNPAITAGEFGAAAAALTEAAGTTLGVERTSVWLGNDEEGQIRCIDLFEGPLSRHSSGTILPSARYPLYFAAIAAGRVIDASVAAVDLRSSEFLEDYLRPLGIGSLLDAPIRVAGSIRGIVCFEHVGPARAWRLDEIRFAGEIADQAAQALLNADRREAGEALCRREERLRFINDNQLDMLCQFDAAGTAVYVSPSVDRVLGFSFREMLGRRAEEFVHPEDFPCMARQIEAALRENRRTLRFEYRFRHADGSYPWLESEVLLYSGAEGRRAGSIVSSRDVTQRHRAEEALRESVREKDVLLKEVHHRVRNNMQVISSLLNLQARAVPDPTLRGLFQESQNRIKAMALVYEKLYRSPDLARIDFGDYVQSLVVHIFNVMRVEADRILFEPQLAPLELDISRSIPLGLVVNELVGNALKHAFPGGRPGTIRVQLEKIGAGPGRARLIVRDDGVGWADKADPRLSESLGLQIVQTLVDQIDGTLSFGREAGAMVEVEFPLPA